ncbi:hypothetical protein AVEN_151297-1 [Araneus ventricosus]|uniref:Uncharacterized protein n=1 Tax=Araneus ventricosus TaxID=182803 RepID=A0A4Y2RQN4_ARAVE|nr:hypothetical protein AVEN_151297-1 [Araneus ventricosus]
MMHIISSEKIPSILCDALLRYRAWNSTGHRHTACPTCKIHNRFSNPGYTEQREFISALELSVMKIVEPFLLKGFPRLFFRSLKPAVYAICVCPFVITIPNGTAPAAYGVKKNVME